MSNLTIAPTICQFLFKKEVEQVFEASPHAYLRTNKEFVEQCLKCCMQAHHFFLSYQEGFFLVDPAAHNNQCHLYALKAAQIQVLYSHQTEEEKLTQSEDNRFLHLALFLSYFFLHDPNFYLKAIEGGLKKMNITIPTPKKHFQAFLRDEGRCREKASRLALNQLFKKDLLEIFSSYQTPLYQELHAMALEDLDREEEGGRASRQEKLYTYPKMAGVAYLLDVLAKEKIAMVLKVKVLTEKGAGGVILQANQAIHIHDPVLVFEAIATEDSYSLAQFREEARSCPTYTYRHPEKNKRHAEKDICAFCSKNPVDLTPFREHVKIAMLSPEKMLYALGADFVLTAQQSFQSFFTNCSKYPLLSHLFEEALENRRILGLASPGPKAFSMFHVHFEKGLEALSEKMVLDQSPETLLKERSIL